MDGRMSVLRARDGCIRVLPTAKGATSAEQIACNGDVECEICDDWGCTWVMRQHVDKWKV